MKIKLMASFIPALFAASSFAADIEGATSIVKFKGNITTSTCEIDLSTSLLDVDMGTVSDQSLKGPGTTSSEKSFKVNLKGCNAVGKATDDGLTGAYIKFKGNTGNDAKTLLTSDNQSVGIQVTQGTELVTMDGSAPTPKVDFDDTGSATLNFTARYIQISDELKTGPATAQADFTVYYQ